MARKLTLEQLYNKPLSDIIMIAVEDIKNARKKGHEINMGHWGSRNGSCVACFAGHCILSHSDANEVSDLFEQEKFVEELAHALNCVRSGNLICAAQELYKGITKNEFIQLAGITTIHQWSTRIVNEDFPGFIKDMKTVSKELKAIGF